MSNIKHSSANDCYYTPLDIIERARATLGRIDLDPASDAFGNSRVKASMLFNSESNGLLGKWIVLHGPNNPITVFCNPPGGKIGNQSKAALFWRKLMELREAGGLAHAIFLAFSAEALQTTQGKGVPSIGDFYCCIPSRRIRFDRADGKTDSRAPSHSNAIVYVPGTEKNLRGFVANFDDLGVITSPLHGVPVISSTKESA